MKKVSVIMVTYNNEKYIKEAVDSLLAQSFSDFELIIVWDRCSSDDKTKEIILSIQDPRIRFIENEKRKGLYYARNVGLDNCTGKYIINFDADDVAKPEMLGTLAEYLDNNECDCVAAGLEYIDEKGNVILDKGASIVYRNPGVIASMLLWQDAVANCGAMFRKKFVDKYRIRYKKVRHAEDYLFWIDVSYNGIIQGLDRALYYYRRHSNSGVATIDNNNKQEALNYIHRYTYNLWNFKLESSDEEKLLSMCGEAVQFGSEDEIRDFVRILRIMIQQAEINGFPYLPELKIACRLRFSEIIKQTKFVWD